MLRLLYRLHRTAGIALLIPVVLVALSGVLLLLVDPSRPPQVTATPDVAPDSRTALVAAYGHALADHGAATRYVLRPPRLDGEAIAILVDGAGRHERRFYHPGSGEFIATIDLDRDLGHLLFEFHDSLLLGNTGKLLLLVVAAGVLTIAATGIVIWAKTAPRPGAFPLRRLHRLLGLALGTAVFIAFASGAYMAWRPLSALVNHLSGSAPVRPPKLAVAAAPMPAALDAILAGAERAMPGGIIGYVAIPAESTEPVRVRKRLADDPHPNGLSSVWIDPKTGEPLAQVRWNRLDPGSRLFAWIYPLHTGRLGGIPHELLWLATGLCSAFLAYSGWRLRARRSGRRAPNAVA